MKWLLTAAVVVGLGAWLLGGAGEASAHAALVRAEPPENAFLKSAPIEVSLQFSETIDDRASGIRLLDAAGNQVATGRLEVSPTSLSMRVSTPNLQPGIYNVIWNNVSTIDGHALQGSYPFTVLNPDGSLPAQVNQVAGIGTDPDPPPEADGVAVRGLSLLGLLLAAAGALLIVLIPKELGAPTRGLVATVIVGGLVLVAASLLNLAIIRDTFPERSLTNILSGTRSGSYWLVRIGGALVILVGATMFSDTRRVAGLVTGAGALVYLWSFSATSHAAAGVGSGWATAIDMVHGAAAVSWIGAVIGIALTARLLGRNERYGPLMRRFALLASAMVFLLLATGLLGSLIQLDTFDRLWETRYGLTLTVKLALIVPLLLFALYNARKGRRLLEGQGPDEPRRFIRTAFAEVALGALVFAAAAAMTQTTVARSVYDRPESRPYDETSPVQGLVVRLQIDPNRTGLNTYAATLSDPQGSAVEAERVRLTFRYQDDQTVGPSTLALAPAGEGRYTGEGPYLTLEGKWRVEAEVRRADVDDVTAFFDVRPAGSAVGSLRAGGAWDNPSPGLTWNEFGGIIALIAALGLALFKGRLPRSTGWAWGSNGMTLLGFGFGSLLLFGVHTHTTGALKTNPIFPDQNSIAQGRTIYQQNCAACHGTNGVPPQGLNLNPYPLDLTVHVPQHPDGSLFQFISQGLPGSAMRSWSEGQGSLTDEQIWHVVNYLRTLGAVDR